MEETGSRRYLLLRVIESETFGNGYTRGVVGWNVQFATMFGSVFRFFFLFLDHVRVIFALVDLLETFHFFELIFFSFGISCGWVDCTVL